METTNPPKKQSRARKEAVAPIPTPNSAHPLKNRARLKAAIQMITPASPLKDHIAQRPLSRRRHRRAAGSVYFLSTILLVAVIGLSSLTYARIQRRNARAADDAMTARFYARSAIELGFLNIRQNPNWWQGIPNKTWATNLTIGDGTLSLAVVVAPSGLALGDGTDPALLIGTGVSGDATRTIQVLVDTQGIAAGSGTRIQN